MDYTKVIIETVKIFLTGIGLFFGLWVILIFSPLTWKGQNKPKQMFAVWVLFAGIRGILFLTNQEPINLILPEPLNMQLFIGVGSILLLITILYGRIINKRFQQKANSLHQIEDFLFLSASDFEVMIVELYNRAGHKAKRTGATGDHGVDIVVEAKNGEKWVVQCKRWRGSVGEPIIRDFYGVVQHEKADKGIVITTGRFTAPAQHWAKGKPISLYDGHMLVEIWARSKRQAAQIPSTVG